MQVSALPMHSGQSSVSCRLGEAPGAWRAALDVVDGFVYEASGGPVTWLVTQVTVAFGGGPDGHLRAIPRQPRFIGNPRRVLSISDGVIRRLAGALATFFARVVMAFPVVLDLSQHPIEMALTPIWNTFFESTDYGVIGPLRDLCVSAPDRTSESPSNEPIRLKV